jgi:hypothetical protein
LAEVPYIERRFGRHAAQRKEFEARFRAIDLGAAWSLCSCKGIPHEGFEKSLKEALVGYDPNPRPASSVPSKERSGTYQRLEKATVTLLAELDQLNPVLWREIEETFEANAPTHVELLLADENEGLSYGEFQTEKAIESVSSLLRTLRDARDHNIKPAGRPKQNENLERTMRSLGAVFERTSGNKPMQHYTREEAYPQRPYRGPFIEFLCETLWAFNGREYPGNGALGETALRVFGKRKS